MSFGLKNVDATYQSLMDYIFKRMLSRNVEVYVEDNIVKSNSCQQHVQDLKEVFQALRDHVMRLNLNKCAFGVEWEFLGFMLTHRGIEANPEKSSTITKMHSRENDKEIQRLIGRLTTLSRFVSRLEKKTKPIVQLLCKVTKFQWTEECHGIFLQLKVYSRLPGLFKIRML